MPELRLDEATHEYHLDGALIPSVTQVLKEAGLISFEGIDPALLEFAQARGKAVHAAIHFLDEGDLLWASVNPLIEGYIRAYEFFKETVGFVVEQSERQVFNPTFRFAGTLDCLGSIRGRGSKILVDLKTSPVMPWVGLQLAGYDLCLDRTVSRERWAVHLSGDGKFYISEFRDRSDQQIFLSALAVANWRRNHNGK